MTAIRIRFSPDAAEGLYGDAFRIEASEAGTADETGKLVAQFCRWVLSGMTFYGNKGGIEQSSLFKSYAAECFEELARDDPQAAASLTGLTVICEGLPPTLKDNPFWLMHRAVLATLPNVRLME